MKKLLLVQTLSCLYLFTSAQTIITAGVKDNKGRPVAGASIAIKDSYDGATSDSTGKYNLRTTEKGQQTVLTTSIGYKLVEQKVELKGERITLDVILKEEPNELKAVV